MFSDASHPLYWSPQASRHTVEGLVFVSSGWLKTACVLIALSWVAFRAYRVLSKPVDELVALLGLEVPVAPLVSLAAVKADGVLLHWKASSQRASIIKYVIRINGIDIGDVSPQETSVTIENLQPDHHYVIRIVTLNNANFQAPSTPVRLRTLPADSEQFYNAIAHKDGREAAQDEGYTPTPVIKPNKGLVDVVVPAVPAPAMAREHSNSTSRARRDTIRRNSPSSQSIEHSRPSHETPEALDSIKVLTEKLDALRRELDDIDKQIQDEEEESHTQKTILAEKRDEKKAVLKEKEDASRDLRKEVATLERANTSAQTRKQQQEKVLRRKEAERKRLKDDVERFAREAVDLQVTAQRIQLERTQFEQQCAERMAALREQLACEVQTNKSLEDVIREKGTLIKTLEEQRSGFEDGDDAIEAQDTVDSTNLEEERLWAETLNALQKRYAEAWAMFTEAERTNHEASARLQYLQQRRMSQSQIMSGLAQEFVPARRNSQRTRPLSMREPLQSAIPAGFIQSTAPPFNSTMASTSPSYNSATPYFNPVNGMVLPPPNTHASSFAHVDIESLTAGAPMSPTAGALLPSGLFADESGLTDVESDTEASHGPSPHLHSILPGLGVPTTLDHVQGPSSPVSPASRSPSTFASPRDSVGQLGYYPSNDNTIDSDGRSIRSTSSSFKNPPATRFGGLFGLNRQRGKTLSDDGVPFGSLKPAQSQSLPRQELQGLGAIGTQRRRGSHSSGAWYNAFMPTKTQPTDAFEDPKHVTTRKRGFNMFGAKEDPWLTSAIGNERPSSPRQGSTNSAEPGFSRPSVESQNRFGWSMDAFNARSSPLGMVDWSVNNTNTSSWSRLPSRRPSVQHGSSASLIAEDLLQDDLPDLPSTLRSPTQAPIGTRPASSASHMQIGAALSPSTQLNPNAPQFKSIFLPGKKSEEDKAEKVKKAAEKAAEKEAKRLAKEEEKRAKAEKASRKDKAKASMSDIVVQDFGKDHTSPPKDPRRSRDSRSISTADHSDASPRESLERSISQMTSDSYLASSSLGKESFMQKLTRKSSSGQFLPFGKGKSFLISKKSSEVVTPDEMDEDANGFLAIRNADSASHSPATGTPKDKASALSWSSIKRMGKRGDKTPSLHESIASETTGDEDEDGALVGKA